MGRLNDTLSTGRIGEMAAEQREVKGMHWETLNLQYLNIYYPILC